MSEGEAPAVPAAQLLRACTLPAAEARALLCHVLALRRETLIAHPETPVGAPQAAQFSAALARRAQGVPMAYLLGGQEFYGHYFEVAPAVLIPRPDTEVLVDTALQELRARGAARVLDLGTGSGCIAIALALARPDFFVVASDRSEAALHLARRNAARLGARVHFLAGAWLEPIGGVFDLIVANPPYIAFDDAHLDGLAHEPRTALTDGGDGLGHLRQLIATAPARLAPGGLLLLEHGYDQGAAVRAMMQQQGLSASTLLDLGGRDRACLGTAALR